MNEPNVYHFFRPAVWNCAIEQGIHLCEGKCMITGLSPK